MVSFRLDQVRAVLIGERELREVWERFPNMWFCASCCPSCMQCTWWESAYFTFCARALFARVCCRLYNRNWWPAHNARTSAQRPIRARKPGNYFITGSCGKIPRDLRTTELIAIFTPWHLLCFALFILAVINLESKCGSLVEISFSTNSDWFGNQKNLLGG